LKQFEYSNRDVLSFAHVLVWREFEAVKIREPRRDEFVIIKKKVRRARRGDEIKFWVEWKELGGEPKTKHNQKWRSTERRRSDRTVRTSPSRNVLSQRKPYWASIAVDIHKVFRQRENIFPPRYL
jgi:hypothetical protein